jgi:hypothetical protein
MSLQSVLVPDGIQTVDIYYDIDADAEKFDVLPITFCVPNEGSQEYTSGTCIWNFASDCRLVGVLDLVPTMATLNVAALRRLKGKRRCWLRVGVEVGVDIAIIVSWGPDGRRVKDDVGLCSARLTLKNLGLPTGALVNEFRTPVQQRQSSDSSISDDSLPDHLEGVRVSGGKPTPVSEKSKYR